MAIDLKFIPKAWLDDVTYILEETTSEDLHRRLYIVYKAPSWYPVTRVEDAEMFLTDHPKSMVVYKRGDEQFVEYQGSHIGMMPEVRFDGTVTISVVTGDPAEAVTGAVVTLKGEDPVDEFDAITTGATGIAAFTVKSNTFAYTVNATGYDEATGEVEVFAGNMAVTVALTLTV